RRPPPRPLPYTTLFRSSEGTAQLGDDPLAALPGKLRHGRRELRGLKRRQVVQSAAEEEARDDFLLGKLRRGNETDFRRGGLPLEDRKSTRLNSSHVKIS